MSRLRPTSLRPLPADERGLALVTVLAIMLVVTLLAAAALTATTGSIAGARSDQDSKEAAAATDAGLALFTARLARDTEYWGGCETVTDAPVSISRPDPSVAGGYRAVTARRYQGIDQRTAPVTAPAAGEPSYSIELILAQGQTSCRRNDPFSVVDPSTNGLRVRVTGRAAGRARSVVATLRRGSFTKFLYNTDSETQNPELYPQSGNQQGTGRAWARTACAGTGTELKRRSDRDSACQEIQFADADAIEGPTHTNDESFLVCGTPQLGRPGRGDPVEVTGGAPGYRAACGGASIAGITPNSQYLKLPATVGEGPLPDAAAQVDPSSRRAYTFQGVTIFDFKSNGTMDVISSENGYRGANMRIPANGAILVSDAPGCTGLEPPTRTTYNPRTEDLRCGVAIVSGQIPTSLTIGSLRDILVWDDLTQAPGTQPYIGLAADGYVRVYHPTRDNNGNCNRSTPPEIYDLRIDAAILAVRGGFGVDNWDCGRAGTLTVNGSITQKFRGPVATTGNTGYIKDYNYDGRLLLRNPPWFPEPTNTLWRVSRSAEQLPPTP